MQEGDIITKAEADQFEQWEAVLRDTLYSLRRIANMEDRDGHMIEMHPREMRAIAGYAALKILSALGTPGEESED